jgi:hypothetical protein
MAKPDYDTTLARIAGNICAGLIGARVAEGKSIDKDRTEAIAERSVQLAEAIVRHCKLIAPTSEV